MEQISSSTSGDMTWNCFVISFITVLSKPSKGESNNLFGGQALYV